MPVRVLFNIHVRLLQFKVLVLIASGFPVSTWWQLSLLLCFFQLFYYYNPNFNREHPHLLERCKRRVGLQQRAPAASGQDAEMDEKQPSQSPHGQSAGDMQASPPMMTAPTKRRAKAPPGLGNAHTSPQAAAPTLLEPAGAAGSERFIPLALFFLPAHSSQTPYDLQAAAYASPPCFATFPHGLGRPTFGPMQPEAPGAGLPPCCQPWFAMPVLASASALPLPSRPQCQSPTVPHCLTCTCSPNTADAGDGVGPQCGTC